ncbi:ABC transporter ATP-binding protein [Staphylococcus sp. NRL 16/872]|uniref:ATP-binding cassette domain-containing protein n=1 Tax=Staphylococcus sp. NRL 16/872 TaxID=2930131 RepID=UPI001FB1DE0F|nr:MULTISPECIES: ABC transporter ATP-binding protein [unclassified Staphylococcus]MCJ1655239.1 ABC transporter ATP-binding protein [Staphylococcus sp. NRL 21/187]MCJ1661071.1 ABC transporter ATP-binding protein [Staphylococcus sp. NRL 18/288]MCJ1666970.1 ABC transporter ATP-binding protein [Staphylococcus sp. NRL 19/737]WEN69442.1 ABC transporter ATP-binding protein [Staphylococcus sp. NRL 16/872]
MEEFVIEGQDISKVINHQHIIEQINMKFPYNSIVLIEGKNGSGKSITLKMLAHILKPSSGKLKVNGIVSYAPDHLPSTINLTVKEYLKFIEDISSINFSMNIEELISRFNLTSFLEKRIKECSKGTQQKVNLIQCLARKADIYIMDEPFSGLDKRAIVQLKSIFLELKQTATVVLTSHEEALDYSFVTHKFNLETKHLIVNKYETQSKSMIVKTRERLDSNLCENLKELEAQAINNVQIKVNVAKSNRLIALLIEQDYFIQEVREDNDDGTY